jgi:sugar lactone lactonase YvrE
MANQSLNAATSEKKSGIGAWIIGILCFGSLFLVLFLMASQVLNPPRPPRITLVQDIPLPGVLPDKFIPHVLTKPDTEGPLTPGVAVFKDHFDFQAFDPNTKLLFMTHSGPAPDVVETFDSSTKFSADKPEDTATDGNVLVFDTQKKKLVAKLAIPQTSGMVVAPDRGHVYVADNLDNIIYDIDEKTLKTTKIQLDDNEGPDAVEYDPDDQKLFIGDPGVPITTKDPQNANVSPDQENISVVNLVTNAVTKINVGHLPKSPNEKAELLKFGHDVGHVKYDPVLRRVYFTTGQLTDQNVTPQPEPEPPGVGELVEVDPVAEKILRRLPLPDTCGIPHGMAIDTKDNIAFVVCFEAEADLNLNQNLIRVDLKNWKVLSDPYEPLPNKPDIAVFSPKLQVLFVACAAGVAVFDVHNGTFTHLNDYILGKNTHTIAINEATSELYLPMPDAGGRPTLRIASFNINGS